ncbi:hypothetical protein AYI68_g250 [Smittium mucronatum]|uniref:Uncharacterized protein n=1 Tax=Smittium mucronatum TaxID=133383 RepID=A0A1R0H8X3_9FUNG|nr:hypothetical protein AYI68_g250 [Smittium mucronatum]
MHFHRFNRISFIVLYFDFLIGIYANNGVHEALEDIDQYQSIAPNGAYNNENMGLLNGHDDGDIGTKNTGNIGGNIAYGVLDSYNRPETNFYNEQADLNENESNNEALNIEFSNPENLSEDEYDKVHGETAETYNDNASEDFKDPNIPNSDNLERTISEFKNLGRVNVKASSKKCGNNMLGCSSSGNEKMGLEGITSSDNKLQQNNLPKAANQNPSGGYKNKMKALSTPWNFQPLDYFQNLMLEKNSIDTKENSSEDFKLGRVIKSGLDNITNMFKRGSLLKKEEGILRKSDLEIKELDNKELYEIEDNIAILLASDKSSSSRSVSSTNSSSSTRSSSTANSSSTTKSSSNTKSKSDKKSKTYNKSVSAKTKKEVSVKTKVNTGVKIDVKTAIVSKIATNTSKESETPICHCHCMYNGSRFNAQMNKVDKIGTVSGEKRSRRSRLMRADAPNAIVGNSSSSSSSNTLSQSSTTQQGSYSSITNKITSTLVVIQSTTSLQSITSTSFSTTSQSSFTNVTPASTFSSTQNVSSASKPVTFLKGNDREMVIVQGKTYGLILSSTSNASAKALDVNNDGQNTTPLNSSPTVIHLSSQDPILSGRLVLKLTSVSGSTSIPSNTTNNNSTSASSSTANNSSTSSTDSNSTSSVSDTSNTQSASPALPVANQINDDGELFPLGVESQNGSPDSSDILLNGDYLESDSMNGLGVDSNGNIIAEYIEVYEDPNEQDSPQEYSNEYLS